MNKSIKDKLAVQLSNNTELNKKALKLKKSWDEVDSLLKSPKGKKKEKKK